MRILVSNDDGYTAPGLEALVDTIDRVSLEKKQPATLSLWREALEEIVGAEQPRLF